MAKSVQKYHNSAREMQAGGCGTCRRPADAVSTKMVHPLRSAGENGSRPVIIIARTKENRPAVQPTDQEFAERRVASNPVAGSRIPICAQRDKRSVRHQVKTAQNITYMSHCLERDQIVGVEMARCFVPNALSAPPICEKKMNLNAEASLQYGRRRRRSSERNGKIWSTK